jgi:hypothetical protein
MIKTMEDGSVVMTGNGIKIFQALSLAGALEMYAKFGMKPNRVITPTKMLAMARNITGKDIKARDYKGAAVILKEWANNQRE